MSPADPSRRTEPALPADLLIVRAAVYRPCGMGFADVRPDRESGAYGGCSFQLDGRTVVSRVAKRTPTKNGLFVTTWRRADDGSTRPLSSRDRLDLLAVSARDGAEFGQFVFTRQALLDRGILCGDGVGGKRGFRVYPPWVGVSSAQARRTQDWQVGFFLPVGDDNAVDRDLARALYRA